MTVTTSPKGTLAHRHALTLRAEGQDPARSLRTHWVAEDRSCGDRNPLALPLEARERDPSAGEPQVPGTNCGKETAPYK